jgi:DNA-binding beta-propeller fold protein YncE
MKSRSHSLWLLVCSAALLLLAMGCNDTLRQFITPVPSPTGDPGALAHAIILSSNPASTLANPLPGSDMHIDVTGDSAVGVVPLGINPIFLGKSTNRVFAINQGDTNTPPTVSTYIALLPQSATVTTATLPSSALAPVAGATSSSGNIFIANSGSNDISVISGTVLAVTVPSIPVGTEPVMIAGNAANNKIFVVNHNGGGAGSVTEISTIDNTVIKPSIAVGTAPIWAVMSTDGLFVFVVNQGDGTVTVIDASTDAVLPCSATDPACSGTAIKVGTSPNFAFYEPTLRRLYVSNTGSNTISVIRADNVSAANPPTKLKEITVSGAPTSVTALSNGSKIYAALGNCPAGTNHVNLPSNLASCTGNLVSVIDASSLTQTKTITVGPGAVSIDASGDASRVFVANANDSVTDSTGTHPAGTISDIRTSTDTQVNRFRAPQQDPACVPGPAVFCPVQTPFRVIAFPYKKFGRPQAARHLELLKENSAGAVVCPAPPVVPHGNVHKNVSAGRIEAHYERFLVFIALFTQFVHVHHRRVDLEAESLIVERGNRAADHHVGQLADGFPRYVFALRHRRPRKIAGHPGRCRGIDIEDDPAFDIAFDRHQ